MKCFLRQHGFVGEIGFVDLGWRASLQASIHDLMQGECNVHGYYFGSIVKADRHSAFYFENGRPFHRCSVVFQALPVFEFLFTEPIHSLARVLPLDSGSFDYEFVHDEPQVQIQHREEISKGCRRFFDVFYRVRPYMDSEYSPGALDRLLSSYLVAPSQGFLSLFLGVGHAEGFGGAKYGELIKCQDVGFPEYRNSYWRSAYVVVAGSRLLRLMHNLLYSRMGMFMILNKNRVLRIFKSTIKL